jgi:O-antigen/teichoic acid export membrane protein
VFKNIIAVLRGTVVAQAISIALMPVLTRLLGPAAFGQFQLYQSFLVPLLVLVCMRYEIAILQAEEGPELSALLHLCIGTAMTVSLLVCLLGGTVARTLFSHRAISAVFVLLLALGALFGGLFIVFGYLAVRFHDFRLGAVAKVVQAAVTGTVGIFLGWLAAGPLALILGDAVGRLVGSASYIHRRSRLLQCLATPPSFAAMKRVALKFRSMPTVSAPGGLVNAAGAVITPLGLYAYFSASAAGHFGIVERCIVGPLGILGVAISQVFMADLSRMIRERRPGMVAMYWVIVRRTLIAGVAIAVVFAIIIPHAVVFVFGREWTAAGRFAQLLTPLFSVTLTASAVSMTLLVSGYQRLQLLWEVMRLLALAGVWLLVSGANLTAEAAVAIHGLAGTAMYAVYIGLSHYALRQCERDSARPSQVQPA